MSDLANLEAQLAAVKEAREARRAAAAEAKRVALLRAQLAAAPAIDEAEEQYGVDGVAVVETPGGPVVLKSPGNGPHFKRFQDTESPKAADFRLLVDHCRIWPEKDEYAQLLETYPGVLATLTEAVLHLVGVRIGRVQGK